MVSSASEKNVPIACYVEYFSSGRKDKITKHDLVEHFIFNIPTGALEAVLKIVF